MISSSIKQLPVSKSFTIALKFDDRTYRRESTATVFYSLNRLRIAIINVGGLERIAA